jgi:putative membrane protein
MKALCENISGNLNSMLQDAIEKRPVDAVYP